MVNRKHLWSYFGGEVFLGEGHRIAKESQSLFTLVIIDTKSMILAFSFLTLTPCFLQIFLSDLGEALSIFLVGEVL